VVALHIATDEEICRKVEEKWRGWNSEIELVTVYSPYRLVIQPILDYIINLEHQIKHYRKEAQNTEKKDGGDRNKFYSRYSLCSVFFL